MVRVWRALVLVLTLLAPAAYSQLSIASGNNQSQVVADIFEFTVSICPGGLPDCLSRVPVNIVFSEAPTIGDFCETPNGDCGSPSKVVATSSNGQATAYLQTTTSGPFTVTASNPTGQFVTFNATSIAGPPFSLAACCGSQTQSAAAGSAFAPLQVQVFDFYGNPSPNTGVTFTAPPSGATGTFSGASTVVVQTQGGTAAAPFTAGSVPGSYQVQAAAACDGCSANFSLTNTPAAPAQYQLSVSASPPSEGNVSANPPGSGGSYSSGTYTATYAAGTVVQLTATPNSGYGLLKWEGGASGSASTTSVTMNSNVDVTAEFVQVVATTVTTSPPGLSITVDGQSYTSPQTFQWQQAITHSIGTTTPQNSGSSRYTFSNWSDGGAITHNIMVNFTPTTYTATFTGTQTTTPLSLNCGSGNGSPQVGVSYTVTCSASGGTAPYGYSVSSGSLPAGWSLSPGGSTVVIGGSASAAGPYSFSVQAADSSTPPQTASQSLSGTIAPSASSLSASPPGGLAFTAYQGRSNPASQTLTLSNSGGSTSFTVTNFPSWVQVSPTSGTIGAVTVPITVTAIPGSLPAGPVAGTLTVTPASGQPLSVNLQLVVAAFSIGAPPSVSEMVAAGATKTDSVTVTTVDNASASVTATAVAAAGGAWLKLAASSLTAPGPLGFTIDATNLSPGPYTGTITLNCASANPCSAVSVIVNLTVSPGTPAVSITQVLNATQEAASISQNTWIEIKGTNLSQTKRTWQASDFDPKTGLMPTQLDGVSVTVNGKPAYVYYISQTQVNVLTPLDSALGSVSVQVTNGIGSSNLFTVTMLQNSLGFFAFNSGQYAAAEHGDGSYVGPATLYPGLSTPAAPGEEIVLFANGFGQTDPAVTLGSAVQQGSLPHNPVITLGGLPMNVVNAAVISPGLYQFNAVVPANAPDGDLVLQASYNSFTTQPGVFLTVRH